MRRGYYLRAFTIMELAIALSIAVILVAVGIPRYNSFVQRQSFIDNVQKITGCLEQARRSAIAPPASSPTVNGLTGSSPVRFAQAVIWSINSSPQQYSCHVYSVDTNGNPISELRADTTIEKISISSFAANGVSGYTYQSPFRLTFGSIENGTPVILDNGLAANGTAQEVINGSIVPYGQGFTVEVGIDSLDVSGLHADILMQRFGTPIEVTYQNPS